MSGSAVLFAIDVGLHLHKIYYTSDFIFFLSSNLMRQKNFQLLDPQLFYKCSYYFLNIKMDI